MEMTSENPFHLHELLNCTIVEVARDRLAVEHDDGRRFRIKSLAVDKAKVIPDEAMLEVRELDNIQKEQIGRAYAELSHALYGLNYAIEIQKTFHDQMSHPTLTEMKKEDEDAIRHAHRESIWWSRRCVAEKVRELDAVKAMLGLETIDAAL